MKTKIIPVVSPPSYPLTYVSVQESQECILIQIVINKFRSYEFSPFTQNELCLGEKYIHLTKF